MVASGPSWQAEIAFPPFSSLEVVGGHVNDDISWLDVVVTCNPNTQTIKQVLCLPLHFTPHLPKQCVCLLTSGWPAGAREAALLA